MYCTWISTTGQNVPVYPGVLGLCCQNNFRSPQVLRNYDEFLHIGFREIGTLLSARHERHRRATQGGSVQLHTCKMPRPHFPQQLSTPTVHYCGNDWVTLSLLLQLICHQPSPHSENLYPMATQNLASASLWLPQSLSSVSGLPSGDPTSAPLPVTYLLPFTTHQCNDLRESLTI